MTTTRTHRLHGLPGRSRIAAFLAVVAAGTTSLGAAGSTITISLVPSTTDVLVGQSFTLDVLATVTGATPGAELAAWAMDLGFDGGLVAHDPLTDVAVDATWNPFSDDEDGLGGWRVVDGSGTPELVGIALATLEFEATAPGMVQFVGGLDSLAEGFGLVIPGESAFLVDEIVFEPTSVTITVIPLPSAALLAVPGLLGVLAMRWRH